MRRIDLIAIATVPTVLTAVVAGLVQQDMAAQMYRMAQQEQHMVAEEARLSGVLSQLSVNVAQVVETQRAFSVLDSALQPCKPQQQKDAHK